MSIEQNAQGWSGLPELNTHSQAGLTWRGVRQLTILHDWLDVYSLVQLLYIAQLLADPVGIAQD